jgi:probable HAF family extracellular repeat protein
MLRGLMSLVVVLGVGSSAWAGSMPSYSATDLGTLNGYVQVGLFLSPNGSVTGTSISNGSIFPQPFIYNSANGATGIPVPDGWSQGFALGVNASGQIVGQGVSSNGSTQAFTSQVGGPAVDLSSALGSPYVSAARGINSAGDIVGYRMPSSESSPQAFMHSHTGTVTNLGTLGGAGSMAFAVNGAGQVTGQSATADGAQHAFMWHNGTMMDLGTLGTVAGVESAGLAINASGQIVGWSQDDSGHSRAFLHSEGQMIDLGGPVEGQSTAIGINDAGWVVGNSSDASGNTSAFLYMNGVMIDLQTLVTTAGWTLGGVFGINDNGQIAAWARDDNGAVHALLLDGGRTRDTPEPATMIMMAIGAIGGWGWRRMKGKSNVSAV